MSDWFTIDRVDESTYILSEYQHWEETHCYLLSGSECSLLIDTGLGIANIYDEVVRLTDKPVTAVATHIHWDHIGGHKYFRNFYAHAAELDWLCGQFPLSLGTIKTMVLDRCDPPDDFDIDLGGRRVQALHTPGHLCFWEPVTGYLFTGDLVYKDVLFAYYPSTDPEAYLASLEKVAALPVQKELLDLHRGHAVSREELASWELVWNIE